MPVRRRPAVLFLLAFLGISRASRVQQHSQLQEQESESASTDAEDEPLLSSFTDASGDNLAPVDARSLDESPEFTGGTAYETLCSFWRDRARTKQYKKVGCTQNRGCSSLTIDCNTGDDDGTIGVTYTRSKGFFFTEATKYGIYKKHKSIKGRFLLYRQYGGKQDESGDYVDGEMMMNGCPMWMRHPKSWCEPPKWSKSEDEQINEPAHEKVAWKIQYMWVSWDEEHRQFALEEDNIMGSRLPDQVEVQKMKLQGLGDGIGTMGPSVSGGWYTVGARGWTQACTDNDKPKGTDLPVHDENGKICNIDIWKVFPTSREVVKTTWQTIHKQTLTKKRFE